MSIRRRLGAGPGAPVPGIRAMQADLLDGLPGVRITDLGELRARAGSWGSSPCATESPA
ncbi:hypothetical protein [Streptomyces tauricus]|uniref:hypothetical protein n=1 Tax=Streptomyces tauricus TaxID=68274 RepID=UPI003808D732